MFKATIRIASSQNVILIEATRASFEAHMMNSLDIASATKELFSAENFLRLAVCENQSLLKENF